MTVFSSSAIADCGIAANAVIAIKPAVASALILFPFIFNTSIFYCVFIIPIRYQKENRIFDRGMFKIRVTVHVLC